jgi:outer membrane cobalamin receptor
MLKALMLTSLVAVLVSLCLPVNASQTPANADPKNKKVEVTGSHIKQHVRRIGHTTDAVAPLYVIDRQEIDRSGATTVGDVLRRVTFAKVTGR